MTSHIRYTATLEYCDGPVVIEASDRIGGNYLGIALESESKAFRFLVLGVTPDQVTQVRSGRADLRSVVISSAEYGWFLCETDRLDEPVEIEERSGPIPNWMLPHEEHFLADPLGDENPAMAEAKERDNFAIHIKMEPRNRDRAHRLKLKEYGDVILGLDALIRSAGDALFSAVEGFKKSQLELDIVTPAAAGSLEVVLEASNSDNDLFSPHDAFVQSLSRIDLALQHTTGVDHLKQLSSVDGPKFTISLMKLFGILNRSNIDFRYSWAEPQFQLGNVTSLKSSVVSQLVQSIQSKSHDILHTSTRNIEGRFSRFNREKGTWGLETENELVTGIVDKTERPEKLDGLVVDQSYVFQCKEKLTFGQALRQEPPTLVLQGIVHSDETA